MKQLRSREQIEERIKVLEKEIDDAPGWGAGVSMRGEELNNLKRLLRWMDDKASEGSEG